MSKGQTITVAGLTYTATVANSGAEVAEAFANIAAGATVITPNRSEMQQVVGAWHSEQELADKAQNLRQQLGLQAVIVTRSEEGMSLFDAQGASHVGAQAQEVFDVTGAGDTVIATLAVLVGAGLTLREAMPWANKAGGYVVGKLGTATVSHAELFGAAAPL